MEIQNINIENISFELKKRSNSWTNPNWNHCVTHVLDEKIYK